MSKKATPSTRPQIVMWRWIWIAYPVLLVVGGSWLLYQINSSPGDAAIAEVAFAIVTWGLSPLVWLAVMGLGFMLLALTNGAGGVVIELLAAIIVFGLLGVAQLFIIRLVIRAIRGSTSNASRD